ncbi:hypothetical protein BSU04_04140 [Caballeronia sordidicola]|uniref:Uncharacterized protein n=1 Tax=Caballeronia sordidicola TaxID=196367 RepID=A0A226X936_CABSO|nr:hypothetical protein BSU04_04140 [Caballeronia sordidicola]
MRERGFMTKSLAGGRKVSGFDQRPRLPKACPHSGVISIASA